MFEAQHTPPTRPVTPSPQRRVRSLAAASLAAAASVLVSGAATAATAAPPLPTQPFRSGPPVHPRAACPA
jgi:hypothetical protein